MIGNIMDSLVGLNSPRKNNFTQPNNDPKDSFDQIFNSSRQEAKSSEQGNTSRLASNKIDKEAQKLRNSRVDKERVVKDSNESIGDKSKIKDSEKSTDKDLISMKDEEASDSIVKENNKNHSSEEVTQVLLSISQLLSSLKNIDLNIELPEADNVLQDDSINNIMPTLDADIHMSDKLYHITSQIESLLNRLNEINHGEYQKLSQDLAAMIDMIHENSLDNTSPSFIKELNAHVETITKSIQQLIVTLEAENQSNLDEVIVDDKANEQAVYIESNHKENKIVNENSSDNEVKSEHLANIRSSDSKNTDVIKPANNLVTDQSIKSNNNELFEAVTNTEKIVKEPLVANKNSIFEQIVDKIKVNHKNINDEIRIKLKPEVLGEMTIKVVVEKGIVTAKAVVENYHVKSLLDSNIDQLKTSFKEQGISFHALDVSVNKDSGFDRKNAESWANSRRSKQRKIKVDNVKLNNIYEEVNNQNTGSLSIYSKGLDLIV